jgi:hypothetical protein
MKQCLSLDREALVGCKAQFIEQSVDGLTIWECQINWSTLAKRIERLLSG